MEMEGKGLNGLGLFGVTPIGLHILLGPFLPLTFFASFYELKDARRNGKWRRGHRKKLKDLYLRTAPIFCWFDREIRNICSREKWLWLHISPIGQYRRREGGADSYSHFTVNNLLYPIPLLVANHLHLNFNLQQSSIFYISLFLLDFYH
jgi:hypothetical protein